VASAHGLEAFSVRLHSDNLVCPARSSCPPREKTGPEGGFELNPVFQRQVDGSQGVRLRFVLALVATNLLLASVWLRDALSRNELYPFLLGRWFRSTWQFSSGT
jgi:hypothetical protein